MSDAKVDAKVAELQKVPLFARYFLLYGLSLGLLMTLSFCASAFAGYMTWGRAILSGTVQCVMYFIIGGMVGGMVLSGSKFGWFAFAGLAGIHTWAALGSAMRLARVIFEGNVSEHGKLWVMDGIGVARLVVGLIVLAILCSKQVRDHIWKKNAREPVSL